MDGVSDGCSDGWMNSLSRWMDGVSDGWMNSLSGWMDGWME